MNPPRPASNRSTLVVSTPDGLLFSTGEGQFLLRSTAVRNGPEEVVRVYQLNDSDPRLFQLQLEGHTH